MEVITTARKCRYATSCIYYNRLPLWRRPYEDVHVVVTQQNASIYFKFVKSFQIGGLTPSSS